MPEFTAGAGARLGIVEDGGNHEEAAGRPTSSRRSGSPIGATPSCRSCFAVTQSGFTQSYDGHIDISGSFTVYDADVTSTMLDVAIRSDIHYECDAGDRTCDLSGSGIELVGVGGALVSGSVDLNTNTQQYTLRGADTLTATISQGCVAYQISGSDRVKVCN